MHHPPSPRHVHHPLDHPRRYLDPDLLPGPQVRRFVRSSRPVERIALATSPEVTQLAVLPETPDQLNLMAELERAST